MITLSARASTFGGIVRPICFAALQIDHQLELLRLLPDCFFGPLLLTYGITLTILSPRLFSAVIWIEWFFRNSSASSRAATVSK